MINFPGISPPKKYEIISEKLENLNLKLFESKNLDFSGKKFHEISWNYKKNDFKRTFFVFKSFKNQEIDEKTVDFCKFMNLINPKLFDIFLEKGAICCDECYFNQCKCLNNEKEEECEKCGCFGCKK